MKTNLLIKNSIFSQASSLLLDDCGPDIRTYRGGCSRSQQVVSARTQQCSKVKVHPMTPAFPFLPLKTDVYFFLDIFFKLPGIMDK